MNIPSVSIVIPAFNEEVQLPLCLLSLMQQLQQIQCTELIVIDNNSTDETASIAQKFGARVITEKKQGNVFALQAGLLAAKGDIIIATDADSEVAPDWLASAVTAFADSNVVGVTGPVFLRTKNYFFGLFFGNLYSLFLRFHFLINKPHFTGSNFAVRKTALMKVHGLDVRYRMSADVNLSLRLKKVGKVAFNPKMKVSASARRWQFNPLKAFGEYANGYVHTVWLHKPASFQQKSLT